MFPTIAPDYYSYSFNQNHSLNETLPKEIREFVLKASPTLLLAGSLARAYTHYFLGLKSAPPLIAESQHFHFIICHDPEFSSQHERARITPARAESLGNAICAHFDDQSGKMIKDDFYIQISKGKIGNYFVHITFLFDGLKSFFRDFEHNNNFLIDIHRNLILLESDTMPIPGSINLKSDRIIPVMQLPSKPIESIAPAEPEPETSIITEEIPKEEESQLFEEFLKKSKSFFVQTNQNPLNLESRYDALPVDVLQPQEESAQPRKKQVEPIRRKKQITTKASVKKAESAQQEKTIFDEPEPLPSASHKKLLEPGYFSFLFPSQSSKRRPPIRFTVSKPRSSQAAPIVPQVKSSRYRFLEKQSKHMIQHLSPNPIDSLLAHQGLLIPKVNDGQIEDPALLIAQFKTMIYDDSMSIFTESARPYVNEAQDKNLTYEQMMNDVLVTLVTWFALVTLLRQDHSSSNHPEILSLVTVLLSLMAPWMTLHTLACRSARDALESKILLECYNKHMDLLLSPSLPENERIFKLTQVLLLAHELSSRGQGAIFETNSFSPPLEHFIESFLRIINEKPGALPRFFARISVSAGKINRINTVTETILSLASIHGNQLFHLMMKNEVPEITIAVMPSDKQETLMKEAIDSLRTLVSDAEAAYSNPDTLGANIKPNTRDQIVMLMNKVFLIYSLRSTSEKTGYFADFENKFKEFTDYANQKINTFLGGDRELHHAIVDTPDIHQCALKSTLFSYALRENPSLAIDTLERMTRPTLLVHNEHRNGIKF